MCLNLSQIIFNFGFLFFVLTFFFCYNLCSYTFRLFKFKMRMFARMYNFLTDDGKWTETNIENLSLNFRIRINLFMEPAIIFGSSNLRLI